MDFFQIVALLRRHAIAVLAVLMVACAIDYQLSTAPRVYTESGSVVFSMAGRMSSASWSPLQAYLLSQSLIATETTIAEALSPIGKLASVRTARGTAWYTLAPFNSHNLQYPYYSLPSLMLTVSSDDPTVTRGGFLATYRQITGRLAAVQGQAAVPAGTRVKVDLVSATGVMRQAGSRARVFGGMTVLTVVAVLMVAGYLDRRRRTVGRRRRSSPASQPAHVTAQITS